MTALKAALRRWYFALPLGLFALTVYAVCCAELAFSLRLTGWPLPFCTVLSFLFLSVVPLCGLLCERLPTKVNILQRIFSFGILSYLYLLILLCLQAFCHLLTGRCDLPTVLTFCLFVLIHGIGIPSAYRIRRKTYRFSFESTAETPLKLRRLSTNETPDGQRLRVVLLSDLHLGLCTNRRFWEKTVDVLCNTDADLLLLAGDLFDRTLSEDCFNTFSEKFALEQQFRRLHKTFPLGIYLCEGNHDRRVLQNDTPHAAFLHRCGIQTLCDRFLLLPPSKDGFPPILLSGSADKAEESTLPPPKSPAEFLPTAPNGALHLHLKHRPERLSDLFPNGILPPQLILCGHTHDGVTFPGNLLHRLLSRYAYGLHPCGDALCCTTSGCGFSGLPLRLFTANEIVSLDIFL